MHDHLELSKFLSQVIKTEVDNTEAKIDSDVI